MVSWFASAVDKAIMKSTNQSGGWREVSSNDIAFQICTY